MRGEAIQYFGYDLKQKEYVSDFINIRTYPDGTPLIEFPENVGFFSRLLLRPNSMTDFVGAMFFIDAYAARGNETPQLILPCVPGQRQDRLNDSGDYLFTAKSVAKMINERNFPSVTILDPHSEVISALINNCKVVHAADCIGTSLSTTYNAVISPDAGAEKRAGLIAKKLKLPLIHAWKTRDVASGNISGFGMENIPRGWHCLVVDDICDGGGTFEGLAQLFSANENTVDLFVTHGIFSKGTQTLLRHYKQIFCTDSIHAQRPDVNIIKVCDKLINGEKL